MKQKITAVLLAALMMLCCMPVYAQDEELTSVTLNEVAHSIFYAPQYVAIEKGYFKEERIDLELVTGFGVNHLVQNI